MLVALAGSAIFPFDALDLGIRANGEAGRRPTGKGRGVVAYVGKSDAEALGGGRKRRGARAVATGRNDRIKRARPAAIRAPPAFALADECAADARTARQ
jgi:hypothetical protein